MSNDIVKGNWKEIKGKLKQQWGKLSNDTVVQAEGSYDELAGQLQQAYGYKKEQAKQELDAFLKKHGYQKDQ